MPRTPEQFQRLLWLGAGEAWTMVGDILTGTAVWGLIGYALDRWLGTWPIIFAIGAVVGHAAGIYMGYRRSQKLQRLGRTLGTSAERRAG
jgi:F0F1-type ATP synthase assembly protein I